MGSSPAFASMAADERPVQTRFPWGSPPEAVNRADHHNSPDHYAKGTRSGHRNSPPTARRRGVSGSVSSPDRGSSHRSVALLGSLSVVIRYLALREGPRGFRPGFTCPTLLGYRSGGRRSFAYGTVTRCGAFFQRASAGSHLGNSQMTGPTTPGGVPPGLGWSPFARRY